MFIVLERIKLCYVIGKVFDVVGQVLLRADDTFMPRHILSFTQAVCFYPIRDNRSPYLCEGGKVAVYTFEGCRKLYQRPCGVLFTVPLSDRQEQRVVLCFVCQQGAYFVYVVY